MTHAQYLLNRLNPGHFDWQQMTRSTGEVLGTEDIAAALAGLERGPYLLIRYLWCHDRSVGDELFNLLQLQINKIAAREQWKCQVSRLRRLIQLALQELILANLCRACHGTGIDLVSVCSECDGGGKKRWSALYCARACGIDRNNWLRHWVEKYDKICIEIAEWNDRGLKHLSARLCE